MWMCECERKHVGSEYLKISYFILESNKDSGFRKAKNFFSAS